MTKTHNLIHMGGFEKDGAIVLFRSPMITKNPKWIVRCSCGEHFEKTGCEIRRDENLRCRGCANVDIGNKMRRHGETFTYLHRTWENMLRRCDDPRMENYRWYGARGIKVHPDWRTYETFAAYVRQHLGERPLKHSLDRIDTNGHYEPDNIRWTDDFTQARNKRPRRLKMTVARRQMSVLELMLESLRTGRRLA